MHADKIHIRQQDIQPKVLGQTSYLNTNTSLLSTFSSVRRPSINKYNDFSMLLTVCWGFLCPWRDEEKETQNKKSSLTRDLQGSTGLKGSLTLTFPNV